MLISKSDKFFIAGHKGMVGRAICKKLKDNGYHNILTISSKDLDLRDQEKVKNWFSNNEPDIVVLAAAKVGGIESNQRYPTEFLLDNIKIQNSVIENSWKSKVKRLLFLGSSCIYPKHAKQPIKEEELLAGELEPTNESYALAKILGIRLCQVLRKQYNFDSICLMPSNLYGPGDNYHQTNSHVLAAFIRRFHEASMLGSKEVVCWGTGDPYREFLHVNDLADACLFALEKWNPDRKDSPKLIDGKTLGYLNVGTGIDLTIKELALKVASLVDFKGRIIWDKSKPDGTPRKQLDISRIKSLGWEPKIKLDDGLNQEIKNYIKNK